MDNENNGENWPLSNYPIFLAIILLVATGISSGLGNSEAYTNQLAIYSYFLLVIGVAIRFFELTLPETLIQRITEKISFKNAIDHRKENKFYFLAEIMKHVFVLLMFFFIIALGYGALVDWFFVEGFIQQLVYVIAVFLVLHLLLKFYGGRK